MKWQVPYQGRTWTFDDAHISVPEARLQKNITGGLRPAQAEDARQDMDPDAWVAALVIARRRAGMDVDEAADVDVEAVDLMACMAATRAACRADLAALRAQLPQPAAADATADATADTAPNSAPDVAATDPAPAPRFVGQLPELDEPEPARA